MPNGGGVGHNIEIGSYLCALGVTWKWEETYEEAEEEVEEGAAEFIWQRTVHVWGKS